MIRPSSVEYPPYYEPYVALVKEENSIKALESQTLMLQALISEVPVEKENYKYEDQKWTLKEVIGHVIDTERIMAYRALRFARGDANNLHGFDPDVYVAQAQFQSRSLYSLAHEFGVVRESNIIMFKTFDEQALNMKGKANDWEITVRAIAYVITGHALHHINVIKEKYLD